ncbi:hypothetical protein BH09MYX1_BH09MYX1_49910 [soil metagenome]
MKSRDHGIRAVLISVVLCSAVAGVIAACGGNQPPPVTAKAAPGGTKDQAAWPLDDKSMCNWHNHPELEVSETAGPGALKPNIRRVYKVLGEGDNRRKTLICREVDTNLDGIKDVVRIFNAKGEAQREEADTDYDGRIDHWLMFADGRVVEEDSDTNADGRADEWKVYVSGQLSRIKRDRNGDGKPDVWEIYVKGRLERMGVDDSNDGHVDRWDRDELLRQQQDALEAKTLAQMDGGGGPSGPSPTVVGDAGISDAAADAKAKRQENR